jgi:hypothetical protein
MAFGAGLHRNRSHGILWLGFQRSGGSGQIALIAMLHEGLGG